MRKVVMQTAEPSPTRKSTDIVVRKLDSAYAEADPKQVANNASQLNSE